MDSGREQIADDIRTLLGLELTWTDTGQPTIADEDVPQIKWPRKMVAESTIVLDPSAGVSGFCWPLPRFEILVANLDAIGFMAACSERTADGEYIQRAQWDISRDQQALKKAAVIKEARLWVGHDTIWRYVAAAVGTPQIVLQGNHPISGMTFNSTTVISATDAPTESLALGPISVKQVSEAILSVLNKRKAQ